MRSPYLRTTLVALLLVSLAATARCWIRVEPVQLGNLFLTNEMVEVPLRSDAAEIRWQVTDYFGKTIAEGRKAMGNTRAVLRLGKVGVGYFDLHLTERHGTSATSTVKTSFWGDDTLCAV
jgi:hypothetical protein